MAGVHEGEVSQDGFIVVRVYRTFADLELDFVLSNCRELVLVSVSLQLENRRAELRSDHIEDPKMDEQAEPSMLRNGKST